MKSLLLTTAFIGTLVNSASAAMMIDFNSDNMDGAAHNQSGYQAYTASHEVAATFVTQNYNVNFALTGAATVSLTPAWPNTTDNRVQQAIDRGAANDANWVGDKIDLLTDWLGTDTRTGNGGNGNFDGVNGTPTFLTLTLGGLPAGEYDWLSYHHDTEHMNSFFDIEISTNGGGTFTDAFSGRMTDSTPGGNPDSLNPITGAIDPNPANLPSTARFGFDANGTDDVVLRFTPLSQTAVHQQFFGINGFELKQVPDNGATLGLFGLSLALLGRLRRKFKA